MEKRSIYEKDSRSNAGNGPSSVQIETVKYQLLDPMLLNEVQRQQAQIRELQERLDKIESALVLAGK